MSSLQQLFGLDDCRIVAFQGARMHESVLPHWRLLQEHALEAGFRVKAASAYRSFDQQLAIWNAKASGQRKLLDRQEREVDPSALSPIEMVMTILNWSALPGTSRHHWGTELDIYDAGAMPADYKLQLCVSETTADGVFAEFYCWLDAYLNESPNDSLNGGIFFRPYSGQNRVSPEPWHLSCQSIAQDFQSMLSLDAIADFLSTRDDLILRDVVLENIDMIFAEYIAI